MIEKSTILIIIAFVIQATVLPRFPKYKILIYIFPSIILIYGIYSTFIQKEYNNQIISILLYFLFAFIMFMTGYVSRVDRMKSVQEKISNDEFRKK